MSNKESSTGIDKFLATVERLGNKVPHPIILFTIFCFVLMVISHLMYMFNTYVIFQGVDLATNEVTMQTAYVRSLLTTEGIRFIFTSAVSNYQNMPAKAVVLVAMLGVGVAEGVGLIGSVIKKSLFGAPPKFVTVALVFIGLFSSIASDAGYLVVIPLGASIFHSMGRHPLAGLAAAFAGVAAGFGANVIITPVDAMLVSITNEAIALVDPSLQLDIMSNFYFGFASTFVIGITASLVTIKIIEPRLGKYSGETEVEGSTTLSPEENRGLRFALFAFLGISAFLALLTLPQGSVLRNPETSEILSGSPFIDSLVFIIMLVFLVPGIAYAFGSGSAKKLSDIIPHAIKAMSDLGSLLAILFFIAQFIQYINYTRIGTVVAVQGALALETIGLTGIPLIIAFIILCIFLNLLISGMITKWAVFAPIFIPMLMQMGISPAMTQAAYRIGDSTSNVINPIMGFFALIVVFAQKYQKDAGVGTIVALMLPYTIAITIAWVILLILWYFTGLPLGPGAYVYI